MTEEPMHLDASVLVDLAEGAPVDATHRQHLDGCALCRQEIDELQQTISQLKHASKVDGGSDAALVERANWERLETAVRERLDGELPAATETGSEVPGASRTAWAAWLPLVACLALMWSASVWWRALPTDIEVDDVEGVVFLPPLDEDSEFQFLVDLSGLVDERREGSSSADAQSPGDEVIASWFGVERREWGAGVSTADILELEQREREAFAQALADELGGLGEAEIFGPGSNGSGASSETISMSPSGSLFGDQARGMENAS